MRGTTSFPEPVSVTFDDVRFWVELADGRVLGVPLAWFPRLLNGPTRARSDFFLSPDGIHWDELDEDISVAGLLAGCGDMTQGRAAAAE